MPGKGSSMPSESPVFLAMHRTLPCPPVPVLLCPPMSYPVLLCPTVFYPGQIRHWRGGGPHSAICQPLRWCHNPCRQSLGWDDAIVP